MYLRYRIGRYLIPKSLEKQNMKMSDAAKLLEINGTITPSITKKAYKKACIKFHPDRNPAGEEMMKAINQAFEALKDFEGEVESGGLDYSELLNNALSKIINIPNINIEVCGAWVWVTGDTRPHAKALGKSGAGFFYASKKKAWYFRPDDYKSSSRGKRSLDDIRSKYGSQSVRNQFNKRLAS